MRFQSKFLEIRHFLSVSKIHVWNDNIIEIVRLEGPFPVQSGLFCSCLPDNKFLIRNLIYPLQRSQPYSPTARCNVHNGYQPPVLMKFTSLGHSMYTFSMDNMGSGHLFLGDTVSVCRSFADMKARRFLLQLPLSAQDQAAVWAESKDHTPTETTPCIEITLCEPRQHRSSRLTLPIVFNTLIIAIVTLMIDFSKIIM